MTFATNHLGPFALTEALVPHLPDGASVVFVVSGVEAPERKPAKAAGFRGGRYISFDEATRLDPKRALSYLVRGNAYDRRREYDRAIADYDEAIRLDPKYAMAYINRGNAYDWRQLEFPVDDN
jgi:tetratricopeptide (TPR) repeat protein